LKTRILLDTFPSLFPQDIINFKQDKAEARQNAGNNQANSDNVEHTMENHPARMPARPTLPRYSSSHSCLHDSAATFET